ncbi:MAG: glycosyltransferase [Patescibacteria group bacterium]
MKREEPRLKIVITAGHAATTAYSLIEKLREKHPDWDLYWIGAKHAIEGKNVTTLEHKIFSTFGVQYRSINSGRLQRKLTIWTIPSLFKIPVGLFQAFWELVSIKPNIIISFGGHTAFPVVVAGYILGIPSVLHEQTAAAGLANKVCAPLARAVAISRSSSVKYFPKNKTVLTGNLISKEILSVGKKTKKSSPPVIYITGGSRGSQTINNVIESSLPELLKDYIVYHHTGELDFENFAKMRNERYFPFASLSPAEVMNIYKKSDIVVSRAGANTVSEIMAIGRPSVLIPIPWVQNDEQNKNAEFAVKERIAVVLPEALLAKKSLLEKINYLDSSWEKIVKGYKSEFSELDKKASSKLVSLVEDIIG